MLTPLSGIRVGGRDIIIIYTYIPLTLDLRRGTRGVSDIPPRRPRFYQNDLAMRNTEEVTGGT
jgi:hypothetical protein